MTFSNIPNLDLNNRTEKIIPKESKEMERIIKEMMDIVKKGKQITEAQTRLRNASVI